MQLTNSLLIWKNSQEMKEIISNSLKILRVYATQNVVRADGHFQLYRADWLGENILNHSSEFANYNSMQMRWWKKVLHVVKVKKIPESNCRLFAGRSGK